MEGMILEQHLEQAGMNNAVKGEKYLPDRKSTGYNGPKRLEVCDTQSNNMFH